MDLPPAWALGLGGGLALYTFAPWLLFRFSYGRRFRFYGIAFVMALLVGCALALAFGWTSRQAGDVVLSFVVAQVFLWGFLIWQWQWECFGDPADRDRRGKEQFDGRSRRQWNLLLIISPWHVYEYRQHLVNEEETRSRLPEEMSTP